LIIYFPEQTLSLSAVSLRFGVNLYMGDLQPGSRTMNFLGLSTSIFKASGSLNYIATCFRDVGWKFEDN
jgi:hypothetical protein